MTRHKRKRFRPLQPRKNIVRGAVIGGMTLGISGGGGALAGAFVGSGINVLQARRRRSLKAGRTLFKSRRSRKQLRR